MEENLTIDAAYIKRVYGAVCGPFPLLSKILYYRNTHPTLKLKIFIDHHYLYNNEIIHEYSDCTLLPNPTYDYSTPHELDKEMGCMKPGPTAQEFFWDVYNVVIVP